jgi:2'-5' RNA ligase
VLPKDLVVLARLAAARVVMRPFDVEFNMAGSFPRKTTRRPFVLQGDENLVSLYMLRDKLVDALYDIGSIRLNTEYTPHVTLLYDHPQIGKHAIEPVRWRVHEFILVHSLLGQTRHVPLGRWPLLPDAG